MIEQSHPPRTSRPSVSRPRHVSSAVRLVATFGGSVAILIVGVIAYMAAKSADRARDLVSHTQSVLGTAAATLSAVQDAETGQRGYLITADTLYLEPYKAAVALIRADTLNLRELVRDNRLHQQRLDTLEALITRKL